MIGRLLHALGAPFRALRRTVPFTADGRQTLIYVVFAGCGPTLTAVVVWAMHSALAQPRLWRTFSNLSYIVAGCLMIIVSGLGMFVSIRAVKIGRSGFEASGGVMEERNVAGWKIGGPDSTAMGEGGSQGS